MKRSWWVIVGLIVAISAGWFAVQRPTSPSDVLLEGTGIHLSVLDTDEERIKGLSGTESLGRDRGMLFIFDTIDTHGIWMKDMNYPIDIVWVSSEKAVVDVRENVSPDTYPDVFKPKAPAKFVIELAAGVASEQGILTGRQLEF